MKLKKFGALLAALLFAFAVTACNDNNAATDAPAASPAASEAA